MMWLKQTIIESKEWTKTGETNTNLIEALDNVEVGTNP